MSDIVNANINGAHKSRLKILGLTETSTPDEVKARYEELCKVFSPSMIAGQNLSKLEIEVREKIFVELTEAKNLLKTQNDILVQAGYESLKAKKPEEDFKSNVEKYVYYFEKLCINKEDKDSFCDFYDVLGVTPAASTQELKEAYLKIATSIHPLLPENNDINPDFSKKIYSVITTIYEKLSNKKDRAIYDAEYAKKKGYADDTFFEFFISQRKDYPANVARLAQPKKAFDPNNFLFPESTIPSSGSLKYYEFTIRQESPVTPNVDDEYWDFDEYYYEDDEDGYYASPEDICFDGPDITINSPVIRSIAEKSCVLAETLSGKIKERRAQKNKLGLHENRAPSINEIIKNIGMYGTTILRVEPIPSAEKLNSIHSDESIEFEVAEKYLSDERYISKGLMVVPHFVPFSELRSNLKLARVNPEACNDPKAEIIRLAQAYDTVPEQIINLNREYISESRNKGKTSYTFTSDRVIVPLSYKENKIAQSKIKK